MSTVDDFYKWDKAVISYDLIKEETLQKAFKNYTLNNGEKINYGYGWGINEINGSSSSEHGGGVFGFTTNAIYMPDENVFVVMFTNRGDFSPTETLVKIAAHAIGKPYPGEKDRIKMDDDFLRSLTGVYEFEDGVKRYITYEDRQLYIQRTGRSKLKLFPFAENKFFFEDSVSSYEFVKGKDDGMEIVFKSRINESRGKRTTHEIPK